MAVIGRNPDYEKSLKAYKFDPTRPHHCERCGQLVQAHGGNYQTVEIEIRGTSQMTASMRVSKFWLFRTPGG